MSFIFSIGRFLSSFYIHAIVVHHWYSSFSASYDRCSSRAENSTGKRAQGENEIDRDRKNQFPFLFHPHLVSISTTDTQPSSFLRHKQKQHYIELQRIARLRKKAISHASPSRRRPSSRLCSPHAFPQNLSH